MADINHGKESTHRRFICNYVYLTVGLGALLLIAWLGYVAWTSSQELAKLSNIPAKHAEAIETLNNQVQDLQEAIANERSMAIPVWSTIRKDAIAIDPSEPLTDMGSAFGLSDILEVMKGQNDTNANHANFLFAAMGIFITIFCLAMPLVTNQILHKDIVDKLDAQHDEMANKQTLANNLLREATKLDETTRNTLEKYEREFERLNKVLEEIKQANDNELRRMDIAIENIQRTIENMHTHKVGADKSKKAMPLQTKEMQPISDTPKDKARAAFQNFMVAYVDRQDQKAIDYIEEAIKLETDNALYYNSRSAIRSRLKQYEDALSDISKAIELDGDNAENYKDRGLILSLLNRYEEALNDYNVAIKWVGNNSLYYYLRGQALYAMKRYDESLIDYNRAIELCGDSAPCYSNRGTVLSALERYEEALVDYGKAINLKEDEPLYYANRSALLAELGREEEALIDINKIVELRKCLS